MEFNTYQKLAMGTCADPVAENYGQIARDHLPLLLQVLEIAAAAADVADTVKKGLFHKHGIDPAELQEKIEKVAWIAEGNNHDNYAHLVHAVGDGPLPASDAMFICNILGLVGEAGELADDYAFGVEDYSPEQKEKVLKELGDSQWYQAATAHTHGFTMDEVAQANVQKLAKRYPGGFSAIDSILRRDKEEASS